MKIVTLAKKVEVRPSVISSYEHGRTETPTWQLLMQLLQVLGVRLAVGSPGGSEVFRMSADASLPLAEPSARERSQGVAD
jgi:transcriptional regulator with XRE-family HTH domain